MAIRTSSLAASAIVPVGGPAGLPGQSTYAAWLALGNAGSLADFIAAQRGAPGGVTTLAGKTGALSLADIGALVATAVPYSLKGNLLGSSAAAGDVTLGDLSGAIPLALSRAAIAASRTVVPRFKTLDGATRYVGTSTGPDAIQNASGDWICLDLSTGVVELEWFGAVGDFSPLTMTGTDNASPIAAAFAAVPDGGTIRLRARLYASSSFPTTYTKGYAITGPGRDIAGFVALSNASGPNIQLAGDARCGLVGFSMLTTAVDQGTGITVGYNPDGSHLFAHRADRRLLIQDFRTKGVDYTTQGWNTHGHLSNINGGDYSQWWMIGRSTGGTEGNAQSDNTHTAYGLIIDGTIYPTDHIVVAGLRAYSINIPIQVAGACEGFVLLGYTAVNCGWLIQAQPDNGLGGRPQIYIGTGHANTYSGIASISAYQNVIVENGIYYRNPGGTGAWVGLQLANVIDADIRCNQFINQRLNSDGTTPELSTTGIAVSGSATGNLRIAGNHLGGSYSQNKLGTGISVAASTPGVVVEPDNLYNAATDISDATGGLVRYGARRAIFSLTTGISVADSTATTIAFDTLEEDFFGIGTGTRSTFTIPVGVRRVRVGVTALMSNASGGVVLQVLKNGVTVPRLYASAALYSGGSSPMIRTSGVIPVMAGDVLSVTVTQNSGASNGLQGSGYTSIALEQVA